MEILDGLFLTHSVFIEHICTASFHTSTICYSDDEFEEVVYKSDEEDQDILSMVAAMKQRDAEMQSHLKAPEAAEEPAEEAAGPSWSDLEARFDLLAVQMNARPAASLHSSAAHLFAHQMWPLHSFEPQQRVHEAASSLFVADASPSYVSAAHMAQDLYCKTRWQLSYTLLNAGLHLMCLLLIWHKICIARQDGSCHIHC